MKAGCFFETVNGVTVHKEHNLVAYWCVNLKKYEFYGAHNDCPVGYKNYAILNSPSVVKCNKNFETFAKVRNKSNHKMRYCSNPCKFSSP